MSIARRPFRRRGSAPAPSRSPRCRPARCRGCAAGASTPGRPRSAYSAPQSRCRARRSRRWSERSRSGPLSRMPRPWRCRRSFLRQSRSQPPPSACAREPRRERSPPRSTRRRSARPRERGRSSRMKPAARRPSNRARSRQPTGTPCRQAASHESGRRSISPARWIYLPGPP